MLDQNEAQTCLIHTLELAEMECSRKLLLATAEVPVAEVISAFAGSCQQVSELSVLFCCFSTRNGHIPIDAILSDAVVNLVTSTNLV